MCVNCEMSVCAAVIYPNLNVCNVRLVTAAVNPSDRLGGMNTCDHRRAREHVRKPQSVVKENTKRVVFNSLVPFSLRIF